MIGEDVFSVATTMTVDNLAQCAAHPGCCGVTKRVFYGIKKRVCSDSCVPALSESSCDICLSPQPPSTVLRLAAEQMISPHFFPSLQTFVS